MSKKFLGRVIAGAALGGASLLVFAPGTALADSGHGTDGGSPGAGRAHHANRSSGRVHVRPGAEPGHEAQSTGKAQPKQMVPPDYRPDYKQDYKQEKDYGAYKNDKAYQDYRDYQDYQDYKRYKHYPTPTPTATETDEPTPTETVQPESPLPPPVAEPTAAPVPTGPPVLESPMSTTQPDGKGAGAAAASPDDPQAPDAWSTEGGMGSAEQDSWYGQEGRTYDDMGSPSRDSTGSPSQDGRGPDATDMNSPVPDGMTNDGQDGMRSYGSNGHQDLKGSGAPGDLMVLPKGWVDGGDGGAAGDSDRNFAGGVGMLGAAALGGIALMRRRRADDALL